MNRNHYYAEVTEVDFDTDEPLGPPIFRCAWPCGLEFADEASAKAHIANPEPRRLTLGDVFGDDPE